MTVLNAVYALFAFFVLISIIVFIHEWGHYRSARLFGLVATRFSIGFGPKLASFVDRHGTEWRFSAILLGGYVSFPGDDPKAPPAPGVSTLATISRWKRAVVVGAGPGINLLLAWLLFTAIALVSGYPVGRPAVLEVVPGSGAQAAGIKSGDTILKVNGRSIVTSSDVGQSVILHPGENLPVVYRRDGISHEVLVHITPTTYHDTDGNPAQIGTLGVKMPTSWHRASNLGEAMSKGTSDGLFLIGAQFQTLGQVISGHRAVTEMSGPIRIARMSAKSMSMGFIPFMYLMALISVAVGVMNLLPIPGLDGGHLARYLVETVIRRDISERNMNRAARVGFAIIAAMGIFAVSVDILALTS